MGSGICKPYFRPSSNGKKSFYPLIITLLQQEDIFTKTYIVLYSCVMQGTQGQTGPPGPPGTAGSSVSENHSLFTWTGLRHRVLKISSGFTLDTDALSPIDIFKGASGLQGESGYSGASGMRVSIDLCL